MPSDELTAITALLGAAKASPDTPLEDLRVAYAGMGAMVPVDDAVRSSVARRTTDRFSTTRSAACGLVRTSDATVLSALNRK